LGAPKSSAHGPEAESVAAAGVEGEGCDRAGSARGAGAAQLAMAKSHKLLSKVVWNPIEPQRFPATD
jgi:hypothetical protein